MGSEGGEGSGFSNEDYTAAGAKIVERDVEVYERSEMIVKVKEPIPQEYSLLHERQIIFSYLRLAPLPQLTQALLMSHVAGVAYETIHDSRGRLPLFTPMSEIAGRMSILVGCYFLQKGYGLRCYGLPGSAAEIHSAFVHTHHHQRYGLPGSAAEIHLGVTQE